MYKYYLLLPVLMTGLSMVIGAPFFSNTCPNRRVLRRRLNEVKAVQKSVRSVFSNALNDSTIANASLSSEEVYKHIATRVGVFATPSGFVRFKEAISEVAVAKLDACSSTKNYYHYSIYISKLTNQFLSVSLTDAKSISLARKYYGELLCIQDHLLYFHHRKKRSDSSSRSLDNFFNCLDGKEDLGMLFGIFIVNRIELPRPTLAFVVDNTGSMSQEISSVQWLIRSFIKAERDIPFMYILTTFNDPGMLS